MLERLTAPFDRARAWVNEPRNAVALQAVPFGAVALTNLFSQPTPLYPGLGNFLFVTTMVTALKALDVMNKQKLPAVANNEPPHPPTHD